MRGIGPAVTASALVLALGVLMGGCQHQVDQSGQGEAALRFARALSAGRYEEAQRFLSKDLAVRMPVAKIRQRHEEMVSQGEGRRASIVQVMEVSDRWPGREAGDVGWAYVAIAGDSFSEGIAVIVSEESGRSLIRDIEWGRP